VEIDGLVGRRVSLRHRIGERDGRPLYSDAVGDLTAGGDTVTVHGRRGPVEVLRSAVVAVRAVPPAPPRRASLSAITRLENLCADAWPAQVDELLGAWRLRAASGYTGRANSALAVGNPDRPVPAALDAVRAFAERTGIGPRVQVPIGSPWDTAVAAEGWVLDAGHEAGAEVTVHVAGLAGLADLPAPGRTGRPSEVEVAARPSAAWWDHAAGGEPGAAQRGVLDPGRDTAFLMVLGPDGTALGTLRAAVVEDHLHLSVLEVLPAARRRGLATGLVAAAAAWGRDQGARWAVLQVALHNTGALALYDRLGFVEHHRYRYLVPPRA
jgi:ribosomal protein S18 acetylase RimI-like enzyme